MFSACANPRISATGPLAWYASLVATLQQTDVWHKQYALPFADALMQFARQWDAPSEGWEMALVEEFFKSYNRLLPDRESRVVADVVLRALNRYNGDLPGPEPELEDEPVVSQGFDAQQFDLASADTPTNSAALLAGAFTANRDWQETKDRRVLSECMRVLLVRPLFGPEASLSHEDHLVAARTALAARCRALDGSTDENARAMLDLACRLVEATDA